jgi:hypothetical protein
MAMTTDIRTFVAHRIEQLSREETSYRRKLVILRWASAVCVIAGIAFPLLAGSALLSSPDIFDNALWARLSGGLILIAAILTGLHKGLKCEAYQTECKRVIHALRSLIEGFEATAYLAEAEVRAAVDPLERRLQDIRKDAFEILPARD